MSKNDSIFDCYHAAWSRLRKAQEQLREQVPSPEPINNTEPPRLNEQQLALIREAAEANSEYLQAAEAHYHRQASG